MTTSKTSQKKEMKETDGYVKKQTFFHDVLAQFYRENRSKILKNYKMPTRKFIDFLNPNNGGSLRMPQFRAFEMYVFLKEFCDNDPLTRIYTEWSMGIGRFEGYPKFSAYQSQLSLLSDEFNEVSFKEIAKSFKSIDEISYSNYIYALSMGVGKTRLMATCIFYEFTLSKIFPNDIKYCHNALVFAPDTTVLRSLREIQTTDKSRLIPPDYYAQIDPLLKFEYLTDVGMQVQAQSGSSFNIIVSNNQKIILKNKTKEKTGLDKLFESKKDTVSKSSVLEVYKNLGIDNPTNDSELNTNQRILKLGRLPSLGVFVDEAHHAFGGKKSELSIKSESSLRMTIHFLAKTLDSVGSHVVACHHFTGTPYVGKNKILPEVVFNYGLVEAINEKFLKDVTIQSFSEVQHRNADFLEQVVDDFLERTKNVDSEGMTPKLAIFAAKINELMTDVKPELEKILSKRGISLEEIVVNVGDKKITKDQDLREFNRLDTIESKKRFILLVNKGTEGWNCRSLFGVALNRSPKSKIFVLQSTMRCLRSIGSSQQTGHIYVSSENEEILDDELQKNLGINVQDLKNASDNKETREVLPVPPPVKFKYKKLIYKYSVEEKEMKDGIELGLKNINTDLYRTIKTVREGIENPEYFNYKPAKSEDISHKVSKVMYSRITLVAEISRYMSKSCLFVQDFLEKTVEGVDGCLKLVNTYNKTLYDEIVPLIFNALYTVSSSTETVDTEVELVKPPTGESGGWSFKNKPELFLGKDEVGKKGSKSFHVNPYSFDSSQEKRLLYLLLDDDAVENVWFTGMFTQGQSDFNVQYIDSESSVVCNYYPDFLVKKTSGEYIIIEVKAANMMDDRKNRDKADFATTLAEKNNVKYHMIAHTDVDKNMYRHLLE